MKKNGLHLIVFCLVALLVACGESEEEKRQRTQAEQEKMAAAERNAFKIGVMPTMDCLPVFLLKDSMLYDSTKVDIRLKVFNAQMDCDTALIGGSVQGTVTDLVRAERIMRKGTMLKYVAATNAYWLLMTNKKARLKEMSQFSDKMIAMTRYSVTDMLTDMALKGSNTKYPAYKVQVNNVNVRLQMLLNNEMDAAWFTEPQATAAKLAGHFTVKDSRKESLAMGVLAFRTLDVTESKRSRELAEFVKAYNTACATINKRGVKAFAPLLKKYMGISDKVIEKLPQMTFPMVAEPSQKDIEYARSFLK